MILNDKSKAKLQGVHEDLVKVVERAADITDVPFIITEGLRSAERQAQLVAAGASQTMRSRHLTGHAVDLAAVVDGEVRWDWPLYIKLANTMQKAAEDTKVFVEWGGMWAILNSAGPITEKMLSRTFADGPHYQLPWSSYPL